MKEFYHKYHIKRINSSFWSNKYTVSTVLPKIFHIRDNYGNKTCHFSSLKSTWKDSVWMKASTDFIEKNNVWKNWKTRYSELKSKIFFYLNEENWNEKSKTWGTYLIIYWIYVPHTFWYYIQFFSSKLLFSSW